MDIIIEGVGNLKQIIAHYKAIPILIEALLVKNDYTTLAKWDEVRNKED